MSKFNIYDRVTVSDDNGGYVGIIMKMVETTVTSGMPDMSGVSTDTTTKLFILDMSTMSVKSVMSDKVEKIVTTPDKPVRSRTSPDKVA